MSHHKRAEARRKRAIERRQKAEAEQREAHEQRVRAGLAELMGPLPEEFRWKDWGFLLPERDGIDTPTGFLPVIDFVREHSFAELRGEVAP